MTLKHLLFAGAAAMLTVPATAGSALAADDTYMCNGERCYDDQADQTRALNQQALDQAQREREDDDGDAMSGSSYGDDDVYQRDDRRGAYSRGDDDRYGDDSDDDDADTNPYDNDTDDDD